MRVLQVIDSLGLGGAEVLLANMVPEMRTRGVDCDVAVLQRCGSGLESTLISRGVPVVDTGVKALYSVAHVSALRRLFRGYDVVHIHLFPAQLWAALAAIGRRDKFHLITTEHNTWNGRRLWWLRPVDRWMYTRYSVIPCNSRATADDLVRWCPRTAAKIRIVPNGIPLAQFENAQAATLPSIPAGHVRLIFVGRFDPQKDHATIVRALAHAPNVHALLVGDGPLRPKVEDQARRLGVADRVTFLGRRSDVPELLKACDIYVHSTTSDGFGIAACEAMAAGLPVLASDVPGLADVVAGAGVLFPMGDDAALARELNRLAGSEEVRERMSVASRARARKFSILSTVDGYIELYKSLLRKGGSED